MEIWYTLTLLEDFFIGSYEETVAKVVSVLGNIQVLQGKLTLQLQYIVFYYYYYLDPKKDNFDTTKQSNCNTVLIN